MTLWAAALTWTGGSESSWLENIFYSHKYFFNHNLNLKQLNRNDNLCLWTSIISKTSTFNIVYNHSSSPCCWCRGSRQRKQSMRGRGGGVWWLGVSCNQRGNSSFVLHAPPHWRLMNRITRFYSEQEADSWSRPCLCPALASVASLWADVTQMESGKMARTADVRML